MKNTLKQCPDSPWKTAFEKELRKKFKNGIHNLCEECPKPAQGCRPDFGDCAARETLRRILDE